VCGGTERPPIGRPFSWGLGCRTSDEGLGTALAATERLAAQLTVAHGRGWGEKSSCGTVFASRRLFRTFIHIYKLNKAAKKPKDLVEYVVEHEMLHLLEPTHNERFVALLSRHWPQWQESRRELNALPLST
jgi:hypothetical protein